MKKGLISATAAFLLLGSSALWAKSLASVDGMEIGEKDVAIMLRAMPGVSYEQLPDEAKKQVLDQAIERKLLAKAAEKEGIQNSKEFKAALEEAKEELTLEVWMRQQMESVKVSEGELRKFYDENKEKFLQPEVIKARHILVKEEKEAKSIITELAKAKNLAETFGELAKAKSIDPAAQSGGDLGWFSKEQMVPEFANAAFALEKGAYSKAPVKTQFGYHVILVEDKKSQSVLAYDEVKAQIEQNLRLQKFREKVTGVAKKLREKAKIIIK